MKKYGGTLLFQASDAHGSAEVVEDKNLRHLHLGTSVQQSSMFLNDPYALEMEYTQKMAASVLLFPNPQSALFLGLGGGSLDPMKTTSNTLSVPFIV
jgi:spermidine synthase